MAWKKPLDGYYKVNVSGVCEWEGQKASIGCVMRNEDSDYYRGYGGVIKCSDPEVAGLWAVYYGLELTWGKYRKKMILEIDDSEVLRQVLIPYPEYQFTEFVGVINQLMDEVWDDLQLDVVPPSINGDVAALVDYCVEEGFGLGEFEDPPPPVKVVVEEESF